MKTLTFFTLLALLFGASLSATAQNTNLMIYTADFDHDEATTEASLRRTSESAILTDLPALADRYLITEAPRAINMETVQTLLLTSPTILRHPSVREVETQITLDEHGQYLSHRMLTPVPGEVNDIFGLYLPKLRFTPAIMDGEPTGAVVKIAFLVQRPQ